MSKTKQEAKWSERSPEERDNIRVNQEKASYATPFKGKNRNQCNRLNNGFSSMRNQLAK